MTGNDVKFILCVILSAFITCVLSSCNYKKDDDDRSGVKKPNEAPHLWSIETTENVNTVILYNSSIDTVVQIGLSLGAQSQYRTLLNVGDINYKDDVPGRFVLIKTHNIWNFILLNRISGEIKQCQFSLEPKGRGCFLLNRLD